jgi:hypothetical protein
MKQAQKAKTRATILLLTGVGVLVGGAGSAAACPSVPFYGLTSKPSHIKFADIPTFKNGPGGVLSVTKDYSSSASYQVTAGAESEVGAVLAKAKVSISASLTKTNSSTVTNNFTHKIPRGKFGNVQYVSWGRTISWTKYIYNTSTCRKSVIGQGTIKFPANKEGWRYWSTDR